MRKIIAITVEQKHLFSFSPSPRPFSQKSLHWSTGRRSMDLNTNFSLIKISRLSKNWESSRHPKTFTDRTLLLKRVLARLLLQTLVSLRGIRLKSVWNWLKRETLSIKKCY